MAKYQHASSVYYNWGINLTLIINAFLKAKWKELTLRRVIEVIGRSINDLYIPYPR